jgi:3-oxoacyl-[acyl-carrier protein] reductase
MGIPFAAPRKAWGAPRRPIAPLFTVSQSWEGRWHVRIEKPLLEAGVAARIPMGRAGMPDEIAQPVLLLVRNGYMTGQTIAVNGGALFS